MVRSGGTIPEMAAKDLILQVMITVQANSSYFLGESTTYHISNSNYFPIYLQGLCHIWIECRLQEAVMKYQGEGFSHIYVACAGTNTKHLIDFLETMFGDCEEPNLEDLETATAQALRAEVAIAEKADVEASEGPIPADKVICVIVKSLPIPMELGLETNMQPETDPVKETSKRDPKKRVTHFYYACCKCSHLSKNTPSMFTHARQCFSIKLVCPICSKEYESHDFIEKHIKETHNGKCDIMAISQTEAEDVVASLWSELSHF